MPWTVSPTGETRPGSCPGPGELGTCFPFFQFNLRSENLRPDSESLSLTDDEGGKARKRDQGRRRARLDLSQAQQHGFPLGVKKLAGRAGIP